MPRDEMFLAETYVRHQGALGTDRVFEQAGDDKGFCLVCDLPVLPDQAVVLVPIGCADPEDQEKLKAGRWVSAKAVVTHAGCAGREALGGDRD